MISARYITSSDRHLDVTDKEVQSSLSAGKVGHMMHHFYILDFQG